MIETAKSLLSVSVVMSVYDRADLLAATIDSVLGQKGIDLEFIIVDDGADKEVKQCLRNYRSDSRIQLIEQANQGLTKALISACALASKPLIARIDVGDVMHADRLRAQAQELSDRSELALVSCWVDMVTEEGYFLYQIKQSGEELEQGVLTQNYKQLMTPFHASVMFRKSSYEAVGGYRAEYFFSQDADLWSRILIDGKLSVIPRVLLTALFSPTGISGQYQDYQQKLKRLIAESNRQRKKGLSDKTQLDLAKKIRPQPMQSTAVSVRGNFSTVYFLAKCLDDNHSKYARQYWSKLIKIRPWNGVAWFYYLRCRLAAAHYQNE